MIAPTEVCGSEPSGRGTGREKMEQMASKVLMGL